METYNERFREQMPVTEEFAYFDHAAVAPLPKKSQQAMVQYATEAMNFGDAIWPEWAAKVKQLRESAAKLLQVSQDEIALVNSTTQGINYVAEGVPWVEGDNVLIPENEFPSNMVAWHNLRRFGVEVRKVPVPDSGTIDANSFSPLMDSRTRLISLSWVGYSSGFRADVGQIVELAHGTQNRFGPILVSLDAIQGLGAFPLNADELDIDFLCADGHKWMLGPEGAGIFWLKQEHLNFLRPLGLGWNSLSKASFEPFSAADLGGLLKATAARYEGGTTNMSGMHGFGESLQLLLECEVNAQSALVANSILENVGLLEERLRQCGFQVRLPSEAQHRSGIVGVLWEEAQEDERQYSKARAFLLEEKIVTSVRGGCLRVSAHAYNNEHDIERLVQTLVDFRSLSSRK